MHGDLGPSFRFGQDVIVFVHVVDICNVGRMRVPRVPVLHQKLLRHSLKQPVRYVLLANCTLGVPKGTFKKKI